MNPQHAPFDPATRRAGIRRTVALLCVAAALVLAGFVWMVLHR